jgi:hypothetical protein
MGLTDNMPFFYVSWEKILAKTFELPFQDY